MRFGINVAATLENTVLYFILFVTHLRLVHLVEDRISVVGAFRPLAHDVRDVFGLGRTFEVFGFGDL